MAATASSSDCSTLPMKRMREEETAPNFQDDGPSSSSSSSMNKKQKYLYEDILLSILDETVLLDPQQQQHHFTSLQPHTPLSSSILEISSTSQHLPIVSSNPKPVVEQEEPERVIRHLLEASDDELGIPNTTTTHSESEEDQDHGIIGSVFQDDNIQIQYGSSSSWWSEIEDETSSSSWWWEIEDEAANYYTLLQSHLLSSIM